jgi:hypothetical protein
MIENHSYRGMRERDAMTTNVRYQLLPLDNSTLYRNSAVDMELMYESNDNTILMTGWTQHR